MNNLWWNCSDLGHIFQCRKWHFVLPEKKKHCKKKILVKAVTAILLLLPKYLKVNHFSKQFEFMPQHIVVANCITLIVLKFYKQILIWLLKVEWPISSVSNVRLAFLSEATTVAGSIMMPIFDEEEEKDPIWPWTSCNIVFKIDLIWLIWLHLIGKTPCHLLK